MNWNGRLGWEAIGDEKLRLLFGPGLTQTLLVKFRMNLLGQISNALRGLPL